MVGGVTCAVVNQSNLVAIEGKSCFPSSELDVEGLWRQFKGHGIDV